jgi:hypothetical protein
MEDLEKAIRKAKQAVEMAPKGHPSLRTMLCDLGSKLEMRFAQTREMEDLEEGICKVKQAIGATPEGHPNLAAYLHNPPRLDPALLALPMYRWR